MLKSPYAKHVYEQNARIYKAMAHPLRLEILNVLYKQEASLESLCTYLNVAKPAVSQHLGQLRLLRLVKVRRQNRHAVYSLTDPDIVKTCRVLRNLWRSDVYIC